MRTTACQTARTPCGLSPPGRWPPSGRSSTPSRRNDSNAPCHWRRLHTGAPGRRPPPSHCRWAPRGPAREARAHHGGRPCSAACPSTTKLSNNMRANYHTATMREARVIASSIARSNDMVQAGHRSVCCHEGIASGSSLLLTPFLGGPNVYYLVAATPAFPRLK